jgi:predicted dehydrogenase
MDRGRSVAIMAIEGGPLRMAVVGVGYFGALHAKKIAALPNARLVAVADIDADRAAAVGSELGVSGLSDRRELFGKVDAVTIAVPTVAHFDVAKDFIERGVHVLLEKPITDDPALARALIDLAKRRGIVFQIGQLARFSAATLTVRNRITAPLYIESYRIAPFKPRGIDVNVILDVMIHDIDLILSLVNAPVESVDAVGAPVLSASEDIANARVRFANGCVATITASRVSTKAERKMRIFEPDSYIGIDFLNRTVTIVRKGKAVPGAEFPEIIAETHSYEEVDALECEISAFVESVRTGAPPLVTGEDGLKALEAAISITDSLRRNRERLLSDMAAEGRRAQRR